MADELHKAMVKMKWISQYTIVEVNAVGGYKLKDKHAHILKSHFLPRQDKWYYQEMPEAADDEDPLPWAHTTAEVTGAGDHVDTWTAESIKEAYKQITITDSLKPILKNLEEHSMSSDTEQVEIIDMVHVTETLKNELLEDEPPCLWGPSLWGKHTPMSGEEPAMCQFFYPLNLY